MNDYSHPLPTPFDEIKIAASLFDNYRGQPAWTITTRAATYAYHTQGCGLASMIDRDGNDWISFKPSDGPRGEYRGIPNIIHPDGGFHPGAKTGTTEIVACETEKVVLESKAFDGRWHCRWTFTHKSATMQLLKADHKYWMLYEGTPGGSYNEDQAFFIDSSGEKRPCNQRHEWKLPSPRWIAFGTEGTDRVLCLQDKTPRSEETTDSFWSMEKSMTVFGFGRTLDSQSKRWNHLTETPAVLEVSFVESADFETIQAAIK